MNTEITLSLTFSFQKKERKNERSIIPCNFTFSGLLTQKLRKPCKTALQPYALGVGIAIILLLLVFIVLSFIVFKLIALAIPLICILAFLLVLACLWNSSKAWLCFPRVIIAALFTKLPIGFNEAIPIQPTCNSKIAFEKSPSKDDAKDKMPSEGKTSQDKTHSQNEGRR